MNLYQKALRFKKLLFIRGDVEEKMRTVDIAFSELGRMPFNIFD
jgi:hypothetical protein